MSHTFAISDTFGAVIDKVLMIFRLAPEASSEQVFQSLEHRLYRQNAPREDPA
jgi:hypothetical protein